MIWRKPTTPSNIGVGKWEPMSQLWLHQDFLWLFAKLNFLLEVTSSFMLQWVENVKGMDHACNWVHKSFVLESQLI